MIINKKTKWRKICEVTKEQNCFNCPNRISINESKKNITVKCSLDGKTRVLEFDRHIRPTPYCGGYGR